MKTATVCYLLAFGVAASQMQPGIATLITLVVCGALIGVGTIFGGRN